MQPIVNDDHCHIVPGNFTGEWKVLPIAHRLSPAIYWHLRDHLNSTTAIIGNDGSVQNHYTSNAWGQNLHRFENKENRYTFTGREEDRESGFMHYRARSYFPAIGRFMQRDPKDRFGQHYLYTSNNPVNRVDRRGLQDGPEETNGSGDHRLTTPLFYQWLLGMTQQMPTNTDLVQGRITIYQWLQILNLRGNQIRAEFESEIYSKINTILRKSRKTAQPFIQQNDPRKIFLKTQIHILNRLWHLVRVDMLKLEEKHWLSRVLGVFQGSLNNALRGRFSQRGPAGIKDILRGEAGGRWWRSRFKRINNMENIESLPPSKSEVAASLMAEIHIKKDLRLALMLEGPGTDKVWKKLERIVRTSSDTFINRPKLAVRIGQLFRDDLMDPIELRDKMRKNVMKDLQRITNSEYRLKTRGAREYFMEHPTELQELLRD